MKEKTFKIITTFLSILVALAIGEIALRILRPERMDVAKYEDIYDRTYSPTKRSFIVSLKPNMERKRWGTTVKVNSYGERDYEYSQHKPEGVIRIAVIGDSVAFGFGIPLEKTFSKLMEQELNKGGKQRYEVLLFGRPGYAVSDIYATYKDKVSYFEPDIIIYAMVLNDFDYSSLGDEKPETKIETKSSNLNSLKKLNRSFFSFFRRHSAIYNLMIDVLFKVFAKSGIIDLNESRALDCFAPESEKFKAKWEGTQKWLKILQEAIKNDGRTFIICIFPYQFQLDSEMLNYFRSKGVALPDADLLKIQKMINLFCTENGISSIDLSEEFMEHSPQSLYIKNDYGHPNERGNEIAAQVICQFMTDRRLPDKKP